MIIMCASLPASTTCCAVQAEMSLWCNSEHLWAAFLPDIHSQYQVACAARGVVCLLMGFDLRDHTQQAVFHDGGTAQFSTISQNHETANQKTL